MTEKEKITIATNLWYIEWAYYNIQADSRGEANIYEAVALIRKTLDIDDY